MLLHAVEERSIPVVQFRKGYRKDDPVDGSGNTQQAVTFTDGTGGSIAHGCYTITINDPTAITGGQTLSLAASGVRGASQSFYRLFGDINGNEILDATDSAELIQAIADYNAAYDYNANGIVNAGDNNQFRADLTVSYVEFTSPV